MTRIYNGIRTNGFDSAERLAKYPREINSAAYGSTEITSVNILIQ